MKTEKISEFRRQGKKNGEITENIFDGLLKILRAFAMIQAKHGFLRGQIYGEKYTDGVFARRAGGVFVLL
jgi:hypothetical protein